MKRKKLKIAVFLGGPSSEHEVSLKSGENLIENLDKEKFEIYKVLISKNLEWKIFLIKNKKENLLKEFDDTFFALKFLKKVLKIDYCFLALHGEFGEDGKIQTLLEIFNLNYSGSGPEASMLGMDKIRSSLLFQSIGLNIPEFFYFSLKEWDLRRKEFLKIVKETIGFPLVVKPNKCGSSVGISLVKNQKEIEMAIKKAARFNQEIMIQRYIKGKEITCGVIEKNNSLFALPPTEIIPKKSDFFDWKAKYEDGASEEITPPKTINLKTQKKVQENAILVFQILGAKDFSRIDMILEEKTGKIYILELNSLPGLTKNSLLPKELKAAKIDFSEFLETLIYNSIK